LVISPPFPYTTLFRSGIRALILTPTRELSLQISENFNAYGKFLPLKSLCIFGGVPQSKQVSALKQNVDILIATPGRLLDLMQQGGRKSTRLNSSHVKI